MILVSGANGFLGQTLINQLLEKKYKIIGLTFGIKKPKSLIRHKNLQYVQFDIRKEKEFEKLSQIRNIEAVFHTAACIDFGEDLVAFDRCFKVNVRGTLNLLEYCRVKKIKKFIYSSTVSVYDFRNKKRVKESDLLLPSNFYGLSKLAGEYLCLYYQQVFKINTIILRYSGLYGFGGQPINALNIFISQAINKKDIQINGEGKEVRDWTYVEDAAAANIKSLEFKKNGVFNIATGKGVEIRRAADLVIKNFISPSKIVFTNKNPGLPKLVYDINKAKKELNFIPTPLSKALKEIRFQYETSIF